MKHLILGTAGHIDHGKTRLVKALTGIDTDTLVEEKRRGISINLGYAYYDLPGGTRLGVIDVPGHMRFIKTMLAGAAGIDFVLLVVAADDSVMPQTREHFDILRLLGVRRGIVVITKIDLVDADTAALVEEETRDLVKGSFLGDAPVVRVSAETGEGMDALKKTIEKLALELPVRSEGSLFRMPVDRSFSVAGFGTVVTGTVFSGSVDKGATIAVLPQGGSAEVRGIEVHKNRADCASTGQRAALNLSGVARDAVRRGDTVCAPGYFTPTLMIDCIFEALPNRPALKQGAHVKFHLGTSEIDARFYGLGEGGLSQIRLSEPAVTVRHDRFILRNQEATATLGGGVVVDAHPLTHKRRKNVETEAIRGLQTADSKKLLLAELIKTKTVLSVSEFCSRLSLKRKSVSDALNALAVSADAVLFKSGADTYALHHTNTEALLKTVREQAAIYHAENPLLPSGLPKASVRGLCATVLGESETEVLFPSFWTYLVGIRDFKEVSGTLALRSWEVQSSEEDARLKENVFSAFEKGAFSPSERDDVLKTMGSSRASKALDALLQEGRIVRIEDSYFAQTELEKGRALLKTFLTAKGQGTVSELRQALGTSRKFAIPLLNYYESKGFLVRQGDFRVLA